MAKAHSSVVRSRRAFSLVELLVVIGLIGVLIAILLPVLSGARKSAMKVVCAGRLRELALAARMYSDDNGAYPLPLGHVEVDAAGQFVVAHQPHQITTALLNQLRPYLKFPEVESSTEVARLPPFVQCPFAEDLPLDRGPTPSIFDPDTASYYTGYAYLGRLQDPPPIPPRKKMTMSAAAGPPVVDRGKLLRPQRAAAAKDKRRAVLWADHVYRSEAVGGYWQYTHARRVKPGPLPHTFGDHDGLVGQHRSFTDASVEWVDAGQPGLEVGNRPPDETASFKRANAHWWF